MNKTAKINWLIKLRWAAVLGQAVTIYAAVELLSIKLALFPLAVIVLLAATSNAFLQFLDRKEYSFSMRSIACVLLFDTLLLGGLLYFSGGSANPFATLFLVHIALAAVVLGPVWTWVIAGFSTLCYLALFKFYVPVAALNAHHHHGGSGDEFNLHLKGMLIAFVLTATLVTFFLDKVTKQIGKLEKEQASQMQLASLATLTAGAAHELGSPLSTISIASGELRYALNLKTIDRELVDDSIAAIEQGVARCNGIIRKMGGQLTSSGACGHKEIVAPGTLVELLRKRLDDSEASKLEVAVADGLPVLEVDPETFLMVIHEIVRNAFDASSKAAMVFCEVYERDDLVCFSIRDQGKGIPELSLSKVKEPFFTTKQPGRGMGLGLFIAELFTRSLGGKFEIISNEQSGTTITIAVPVDSQIQRVVNG